MVGEETRWVSISTIFVFHFLLPQSRNNSLTFVEAPALAPAEVAVDADLMNQYQQELSRVRLPQVPKKSKFAHVTLKAEKVPLPEDDEDL